MKNCKFSRHGDFLICDNCGVRLKTKKEPNTIVMMCKHVTNPVAPKEYPSTLQTLKNAAGAFIKYVFNGFQNADQLEVERRLEICTGDLQKGIEPCASYDTKEQRCKECSCYMVWKTKMLSESCPLGKW